MAHIHIANAQFEWELEQISIPQVEASFQIHPIYQQLQFLPCLYSEPNDVVLVSHMPDPEYKDRLRKIGITPPELKLFNSDEIPNLPIDAWGASRAIAQWAKKKKIPYKIPEWGVVKEVNSKEFSFSVSPKLPYAVVLRDEKQALNWIETTEGPRVFKSVFGLSGRGHFAIQNGLDAKALLFLKKEWTKGLSVIAEPWVDRELDFSTQWLISQDGVVSFLGVTICQNNERGSYKRTIVEPRDSLEPYSYFLKEHKQHAERILSLMYQKGYFGHVGIDAMIYWADKMLRLHPIVEINARKTMGWVALTLQKRLFSKETISLSYDTKGKEANLLPHFAILTNERTFNFSKVLHLEIVPHTKSWKDVYF